MTTRGITFLIAAFVGAALLLRVLSVTHVHRAATDATLGSLGQSTPSAPGQALAPGTTGVPTKIIGPTKEQWATLSNEERFRWLEQLGEVPDYAETPRDWTLAERTSWWGKPLDPMTFWQDRIVWLDNSADADARRHGRAFPPPPYQDPTLPHYKDETEAHDSAGTVEGPNLHFYWTSTEAAFWTKFAEEHPRPPDRLQREQLQLATVILGQRCDFEQRGNPANLTAGDLASAEEIRKRRTLEAKYPPEMVSDQALLWCYVLDQRQSYRNLLDKGMEPSSPPVTALLQRLLVDPKLVTEPLTRTQLNAANAWKVAYLQRLRRDNVDESYIGAYLKAWSLSPTEVFGATK